MAQPLVISNEKNARTEINLENIVCRHVPLFAGFRESAKEESMVTVKYIVSRRSTHGLTFASASGAS